MEATNEKSRNSGSEGNGRKVLDGNKLKRKLSTKILLKIGTTVYERRSN